MRFTTTSSTIFTAASIFILACCVSLKQNIRTNYKPSFYFQMDTIHCVKHIYLKDGIDIQTPNTTLIIDKDGKPFTPTESNYRLLTFSDSTLYFQLNDSIYCINIFTEVTRNLGYRPRFHTHQLPHSSAGLFFYLDSGFVVKLRPETNQKSNICSWKNIQSSDNAISKILVNPLTNQLMYTANYYTFITDSALNKVDSIINNYPYFDVGDYHNGKIISTVPHLFFYNHDIIYLTDLNTRKTIEYNLHAKEDEPFKQYAMLFSKVDSNTIYYCNVNGGIFRFNLKTSKKTLLVENCSHRNFTNFFLSKDEKLIIAATNQFIYLIDSINTKPVVKLLIKQ